MAEDGRPPPQPRPEVLPRRVPGASEGPKPPPQVRRGQLPQRVPAGSVVPSRADAGPPRRDAGAPRAAADARQRPVARARRGRRAPRQRQPRSRRARPGRRWLLAGVLTAILLIFAAAAVALALSRPQAAPARGGRPSAADGSQRLAAEAAARSQSAAWVTGQVSRDDIVACDPVMCSAVAARGFPAGNLLVLAPTAPNPFGADVVIATAEIRSQFGSDLAADYAPEVIASFGTATARIDVRVIAPDGAAAYRTELGADLLARRASGAQLLRNARITASALARRQLAAGQVDSRLLSTLALAAAQRPVQIADFGSVAPGASPATALRFADLALAGSAARTGSSAYLQSLVALLRSQIALYRPLSVASVRLAGGQFVLRIEFGAPSPLGLLHGGGAPPAR